VTEPQRSFGERVEEEHGKLAPLFDEALVALANREAQGADSPREAVARLREAIETHLSHEDEVYYPALWTLRPQHREDLERFVAFHRRFLVDFDDIVRLAREDWDAATERLRVFSQSFANHEVREEAFLRKIEAEVPRAHAANRPSRERRPPNR
jgi:hemerythrin